MELNKIFLSGLTFLWVCSGNGYSADRQDGKFEPKLFQVTTAETRPNDAVLIRGEYLDKIKSIKVFTLDNGNVGNAEPAYVPLPVEDRLPDVMVPTFVPGRWRPIRLKRWTCCSKGAVS